MANSKETFTAGGIEFQVGKINAMKQFHIVRRISPILEKMLPNMKDIARLAKAGADDGDEGEKLEQIAKFLGPILGGMSQLSDEDSEKVLMGLLAAAQMKQGEHGSWAWIVKDGQLMFQDLALPLLIQVAGKSFMHNLSDFFAVLQQGSSPR